MARRENGKHDQIVERIKQKPHLIGLGDVVLASTEGIVWNGSVNPVVPDGVFFRKGGGIVVWDYKASDTRSTKDERTLLRYKHALESTLGTYYGVEVTALCVYGNGKNDDLKVERIG